jgi:phosphoglycerol transferase MdoB-like AlkP superfamily enzyme
MNAAHWHLMINHFPVTGLLLGLLLWGLAIKVKRPELDRLVWIWFLLIGLLIVPVYLSGLGSHDMLHDVPGYSHEAIEVHEDWGKYALFAMLGLSVMAVIGLIRKSLWFQRIFPLLVLLAFAIALYTSHLGGLIRHPEMEPSFVPPSPPQKTDAPKPVNSSGHVHQHPDGSEHHHQ